MLGLSRVAFISIILIVIIAAIASSYMLLYQRAPGVQQQTTPQTLPIPPRRPPLPKLLSRG